MNDKLMMQAIRELPAGWVSNDTSVTRFGRAVVAAHPDFAAMQFARGKWRKIDVTRAVRR